MNNPLIRAVDAHDRIVDAEADMMHEIGGDAAFEPYDEMLGSAVADLGYRAFESVLNLKGRVRTARLNLIWKDFVKDQRTKLSAVPQADGHV